MRNGSHVHALERKIAYGFPELPGSENKLSDRMIKQSLNSVIAKYRDLSVSRVGQLFPSAFGFGKWLICSPLTNHHIFVNPIQQLLIFFGHLINAQFCL